MLEDVIFSTFWSLWKFKNTIVFGTNIPRKSMIYDEVVERAFCLDFQ